METDFSSSTFIVIAIAVLIGLVILGVIAWKIKKLLTPREDMLGMSRADVAKRWQDIEGLVQRGDEMSCKLAVIEADKLLDHALKAKYFGGTTLGERLKLACYKHPKLKQVWPAHLTRNRLVHEAAFRLSTGSAKQTVAQFRSALQELSLL